MANPTKKLASHNVPTATVRVYMDLSSEVNQALEMIAQSQGRTKKGQLEFLIREVVEHVAVMEKETSKREKTAKKGRK